jgi:hypothetical protein
MKIVPTNDILIEGKHSPAGQVATTSDAIGKSLVAQGLAKTAPADGEKIADGAPETASRKPATGGKAAAAKAAPAPAPADLSS